MADFAVHAALTTPFGDDGQVDAEALRAPVELLVEDGLDGTRLPAEVLDTLAGEGLAGEGLAGLKDSTRSPERTLGHAAAPRRGGRG